MPIPRFQVCCYVVLEGVLLVGVDLVGVVLLGVDLVGEDPTVLLVG